jgi:hypothetical protein
MINKLLNFISARLNIFHQTTCGECKWYEDGACKGGMERYVDCSGMTNKGFEPKDNECNHEWDRYATVCPSRYIDKKTKKEKIGTKCYYRCNKCGKITIDFVDWFIGEDII